MKKLKKTLNNIITFTIIISLVFSFLTICNWDYNPMDWNGFSRVFLGIFIVVPIIVFLDDL